MSGKAARRCVLVASVALALMGPTLVWLLAGGGSGTPGGPGTPGGNNFEPRIQERLDRFEACLALVYKTSGGPGPDPGHEEAARRFVEHWSDFIAGMTEELQWYNIGKEYRFYKCKGVAGYEQEVLSR